MDKLAELEIHHVGYVVSDLDKTLAHLETVYGLAADEPYFFRPNRAWIKGVEVKGYCLRIAMIKAGTQGVLEIIEPVEGNGVHRQFLQSGKSGIQHICYSVKDYDAWRAFFTERPAELLFEAEIEDERFGYRRCFYAEDRLTGLLFEIKEEPYFRNKQKGSSEKDSREDSRS